GAASDLFEGGVAGNLGGDCDRRAAGHLEDRVAAGDREPAAPVDEVLRRPLAEDLRAHHVAVEGERLGERKGVASVEGEVAKLQVHDVLETVDVGGDRHGVAAGGAVVGIPVAVVAPVESAAVAGPGDGGRHFAGFEGFELQGGLRVLHRRSPGEG